MEIKMGCIMEKSGNITIEEVTSNFKMVHRSIIVNENIDCLSLGIYVKILTFGKTWNLNIKGLSSVLGLSDSKIRKSISLLEKEGYISRHSVKGDDGKFIGWDYVLHSTPIEESDRTNAGKRTLQKTDTPQNGQLGLWTTPKTDNTENGEENIYKPKEIIDLNNKKTKSSTKSAEIDAFVERIYKMYPSKCPKRNTSLGKCAKDKVRIKSLLKNYSMEEIERVVANEIATKLNVSFMSNFSTFLNNFPDPNCIENTSDNVSTAEVSLKDGAINAKGEVWSEQLNRWLK